MFEKLLHLPPTLYFLSLPISYVQFGITVLTHNFVNKSLSKSGFYYVILHWGWSQNTKFRAPKLYFTKAPMAYLHNFMSPLYSWGLDPWGNILWKKNNAPRLNYNFGALNLVFWLQPQWYHCLLFSEEQSDAKLYAENVRQLMSKSLEIPSCTMTSQDIQELRHTRKKKQ